jgi:polar amino acid transport system substrate-binding protein
MMKERGKKKFKAFKILLCCFFTSFFVYPTETKLTASVPSFPPFYFVSDNEKCKGVAVTVLHKIIAKLQQSVTFMPLPYGRIIHSLEHEQLDLGLIFKNNSIANSVEYIGPISQSKVVVLTELNQTINSYSGLTGLSAIAVIRNAKFEDRFDQDTSLNKVQVESYHQAIMMLSLGRVDAVIGSLVGLEYELRAQNLDVKRLEKAFQLGNKEWWLHLSKSASNPQLLSQLRLAVEKVQQSDLIYQTYLQHLNDCSVNEKVK